MKKSVFLLLLATIISTAGCASMPILPNSMNAQVLQSLDAERTVVSAQGTGKTYEWAVVDAQKVAMAKVLQSLVQTTEERSQFEFIQKSVYSNYKQYIEGSKLKDRRREADDSLTVRMDVTVNKKTLETELVRQGVIKERQELISELQNPSVAVLVSEKDKKKSWSEFAINQAASYLTGRKFQVLDLAQVQNINKMDQLSNTVAGGPQDSLASIALAIGADIYLQVEATVEKGRVGSDGTVKASASVKAFETTTARQLGAATGFSKNYAGTAGATNKAIAEALSDAVDKVLTNVIDYWKTDIGKGNQFLVTIRGRFGGASGQRSARMLHRAIQSITEDAKRNLATNKTLAYRVWYKKDPADLLFDLQDIVDQKAPNRQLLQVSQNRKLLLLEFK